MGWIAVTGDELSWHCPRALGSQAQMGDLLPRGTLMVEAAWPEDRLSRVFAGFSRRAPWPARLSLMAVPGEGLVLEHGQGTHVLRLALPLPDVPPGEVLRLTWAWDSPAGRGRLAAERENGMVLAFRHVAAPPPLTLGDVRVLCGGAKTGARAVSDEVEPLGPMPGLDGATLIDTPEGPRPLAQLRTGDTVRTRGGAVVPVLARLERQVPALGACAPVRVRAPWFGLRQDMRVAAGQGLVIGGSDVAYLFGCEEVLVPVRCLLGGPAAAPDPEGPLETWHQLLLPGNEVLRGSGADLDSLWIGRLRRQRDLLPETLLAQVPASLLPEHGGRGLKVLRPFEAMTLVRARAA
ncbi:Hint domain-containing protein [Maliponia aquimaris]|uniref:Hedgehog/Intein (Hint) domain-containing protein n=1 Tax=Maliponia aquimaris TaxID=1673631 RepID=A0A238KVW8_9RHOB|nr:Hint domain-containing protein [Maliponia aquimaris]SMX46838.1 hypothetical protein MAA8898_03538 [Maliponia aquimaris]